MSQSVGPLRALASSGRRALRHAWWRVGRAHPAPLFVLGNQKAGTTVVAALVAARLGESVVIDPLYEIGDWSVENDLFSGRRTVRSLVRTHRRFFRAAVIKDPSYTFFQRELATVFPRARFAMVLRDPRDNIRSILNRLQLPGTVGSVRDAEIQAALGRFGNGGWRTVLEGTNPSTEAATVIESLALRWEAALDVYRAAPEQVEILRYETFREDKAAEIDGLLTRLGRSGSRDITSQVDRQFQKKGDNSSTWEGFFGLENLRTIEAVCARGMAEMDYPRTMID